MSGAYLIAARRTPVMPAGGAFVGLEVHELAAPVMRACLVDAGIDAARVDEVILSNALGAGGNPARVAALAAGLPEHVAGISIDRQCAGGLDAVILARALVESGAAEVVLAGGAESYSRRPLRLRTDPEGGAPVPYDAPPFTPWAKGDWGREIDMHRAAAALADRLGITRGAQDAFAVASHARAMLAVHPEIVSISDGMRDGFTRPLMPAVAARAKVIAGSVTAANAAVAADGAAFCLVVSARVAASATRALRIVTGATLGANPQEPGLAPLGAIARVLSPRLELERSEIMEAYAVQAMACIQGAGLDPARVNINGGALARGHPVGASGAILVARMFADLDQGFGLCAIAAAGGIGSALVLEA